MSDSEVPLKAMLEVQTITGAGDLLCRVVARINVGLQYVLDVIICAEGVLLLLHSHLSGDPGPYRIFPPRPRGLPPVTGTSRS